MPSTRHATTVTRPTTLLSGTGVHKATPATKTTAKKNRKMPSTKPSFHHNKNGLLRFQVTKICLSILQTSQHGASASEKRRWAAKAKKMWANIDAFAAERRKIYDHDDITSALGRFVQEYCGHAELDGDPIGCPIDGFEGLMNEQIYRFSM